MPPVLLSPARLGAVMVAVEFSPVGVIGLSYSAIWPGYPFIHGHMTPQKKRSWEKL